MIFHGSRDFAFADVTRNYLLAIGCSVTVEEKRIRRGKSKAGLKLAFVEASVEGALDGEKLNRRFTADITNPNDVCYLLKEMKIDLPWLIIERFDLLKRKQRRTLLRFGRMLQEFSLTKLVLSANAVERLDGGGADRVFVSCRPL